MSFTVTRRVAIGCLREGVSTTPPPCPHPTATSPAKPTTASAVRGEASLDHSPQDIEAFRPAVRAGPLPARLRADDGTIIGVTGHFPFDVTLPGGAVLPAPGVTWVSVAVTHRRRGILRALMPEQHRGFVGRRLRRVTADGERGLRSTAASATAPRPCTDGWRSPAAERRSARTRPTRAACVGRHRRDSASSPRAIHQRWVATTPGRAVPQRRLVGQRAARPRVAATRRHAAVPPVHADGYASYRIAGRATGRAVIAEIVAVTEEAHAALWRVLLAMDLWRRCGPRRPLDDPLPDLLTDPRQVRTTGLRDGMWARSSTCRPCCAARRYASSSTSCWTCTTRSSTAVDDSGCAVARTGPSACASTWAGRPWTIELAALGPLLFGGERAATLARAGLLAPDPHRAARVDLAARRPGAPQHGTEF